MSEEEKNETPSEQPEPSVSEETPSLDDLYGEFQSQEMQPPQSMQQPVQSEVKTRTSPIPDPVTDSNGFQSYLRNIETELAAARSEVKTTQDKLTQRENELANQAEEREFRNIAEDIAKKAEVDADLVEAGLLHKFIKDQNFQNMWRNRKSNAQAFNKVKGVLTQEMRGKFNVKTDPQIAENQRAAEEANKGASGKPQDEESPEDKLMKASAAEFDRAMAKIRNSGM